MKKVIVIAHKIPLNYNDPESFVVEVEDHEFSNADAIDIVRHQKRDLSDMSNYVYTVALMFIKQRSIRLPQKEK